MLVHLLLVQENEENDDNDDDVVVDIPWRIPFPQVPWPNSRACVDWEIRIPHHYTCHKLQQPPTSIRGGNKNKPFNTTIENYLDLNYHIIKLRRRFQYLGVRTSTKPAETRKRNIHTPLSVLNLDLRNK